MEAHSNKTAITIIGDRFQALANGTTIETKSQWIAKLASPKLQKDTSRFVLLSGQGTDLEAWELIRAKLFRYGLEHRFELPDTVPIAVPKELVHKEQSDDVMIADLEALEPESFLSQLWLSGDSTFAAQHMSGNKLQGIVVIEACRQMMIAVTELFYRSLLPEDGYAYMFRTISTQCVKPVLPLAATLEQRIETIDLCNRSRPKFRTRISVHQDGVECMTLVVEYRIARARELNALSSTEAAHPKTARAADALRRAPDYASHAIMNAH